MEKKDQQNNRPLLPVVPDLTSEEKSESLVLELNNGERGVQEKSSSCDTSEKQSQETEITMTKAMILKNLLVISFGFVVMFTSFGSLQNLQSTLNKEESLGTGGLSVIYGALVVSCVILPNYVIARLGCKWTIALSMCCYILYMVANFYAVWGTIGPASVIIGIGASTLWSAKCSYLTQIAVWYAKLTGATEYDVINRFFGVFFMIFQTIQIWGNLISSTVFAVTPRNITLDLSTCGGNFDPTLPAVNNTNLDRPDDYKVYTLLGIYVGCAVTAFLLMVFLLDKITLDKKQDVKEEKISMNLLLSTAKLWINLNEMKLLTLLTIYSGIEQAFIAGDYTRSYISCSIGIWNVGYVMICYGVVNSICSFSFGRLVQYVGHAPFFLLAFLLHGGAMVTLLFWQPDPDNIILFYVFAAVWGMGDAVFQTQVYALYGYLFSSNSEAAFANYKLLESLGFIMAFAWSGFLVTNIKLYICLAFLGVGMFFYVFVEIYDRRKKKGEFNLDKTTT